MIDQAIMDRTETRIAKMQDTIAALQQERADLVELYAEAEVSTGLRQQLIAKDAELAAAAAEIARLTALLSSGRKLLFRSDFASATLGPLRDFWENGCWQDIVGAEWPPKIWGGNVAALQHNTAPMVVTPATLGQYMLNRIEVVDGTRALYQEVTRHDGGQGPMGSRVFQNGYHIRPTQETSDLYVSYRLKFQPDLVQKMTNLPPGAGVTGGGTWRGIFAFKTGKTSANDGDYRVECYVTTYDSPTPYWLMIGDNNAGGGYPLVNNWRVENRSVPVPVGQWFKFGVGWHRSFGADGRAVVDINGRRIFDRYGPNVGAANLTINRIIPALLYSGSAMPIYQWVDDLEIWDGIPP